MYFLGHSQAILEPDCITLQEEHRLGTNEKYICCKFSMDSFSHQRQAPYMNTSGGHESPF